MREISRLTGWQGEAALYPELRRAGPSGHNSQPWLFRVRSGVVELYAYRTCGLPVVDLEDRVLIGGCGVTLF